MSIRTPAARTRAAAALLSAALLVSSLSACSDSSAATSEPPAPAAPAAPPTLTADAQAQRGTLVSSERFRDIDPSITAVDGRAFRLVYRSASGLDGSSTLVSATAFVPTTAPPPGGRPVVTVGHGTTGIGPGCGPSEHSDLLGYASTIVPLMKLGYVAVMTDYQGLGSGPEAPGATGQSLVHPYLDPSTEGFNLIDAVRAVRSLTPDASDRWAALGVSQGGQAAWAAAELAGTYGTGLNFVGTVALAPALDLTSQADLAASNFLSRDQQAIFPFLVSGLTTARPEAKASDYLRGVLATDPDAWLACLPPGTDRRASMVSQINRSDSEPVSDAAAATMRNWLESIRLPRIKASGPILVVNGDVDETVRPQWVQTAVDNACRLGDSVQHIVRAGQGHTNLDPGAETAIWLEARFHGEPPPSDC